MVADDDDPAAGHQCRQDSFQAALQGFELLVHGDAERLEYTSLVTLGGGGASGGAQSGHEIVAGPERPLTSPAGDDACQPSSAGLFRVTAEDVGQLVLGSLVQHVRRRCRRGVLAVHPHVEGHATPERESARVDVELARADSKVQ